MLNKGHMKPLIISIGAVGAGLYNLLAEKESIKEVICCYTKEKEKFKN